MVMPGGIAGRKGLRPEIFPCPLSWKSKERSCTLRPALDSIRGSLHGATAEEA